MQRKDTSYDISTPYGCPKCGRMVRLSVSLTKDQTNDFPTLVLEWYCSDPKQPTENGCTFDRIVHQDPKIPF